MASPQKENGYTPIASELFEAFYRCKLIEYERVCIMYIWRKTYGWSKKDDWIANSQFSEETGIPRPHITRTLKKLVEKKIILKVGKKMTVNKNYEEWEVEWRVTSSGNRVTSSGNEKLPHEVPTITNSIITKEISETNVSAEKKMTWNKHPDDYEESTIDFDGDGVKKKPARPQTKKYPNAPAVRKIFQDVLGENPFNWNKNKTQLIACENLFAEKGVEKIRNALEFYKEHNEKKYCPSIHTPYDLDSKWAKLGEFKLKL